MGLFSAKTCELCGAKAAGAWQSCLLWGWPGVMAGSGGAGVAAWPAWEMMDSA